jgi:hypothetical protein
MKNYFTKIKIFTSLVLILSIINSCDVLQKEPLDSLIEEDVWNNEVLANEYLTQLYISLMPTFSGTATSSLCDESFYSSTSELDILYGRLSIESISDFASSYITIRKINLLFNRIDKGTINIEKKRLIKGQAHFFRAWIYWNLVRLYGGVPIITEPQVPVVNGEIAKDLYVKRSKTRACIEFIAAELDSAYKMLPSQWPNEAENYGRITRDAALAFKGRVLLFWASPQFNPENKIERWQWAYNVNKQAVDTLEKDGYGLHPSFKELFVDCKEKTKEAIMVRVYDTDVSGNYYHNYDYNVRPAVEGKSGGGKSNNPTWQFVKSFPLADGYPIYKADNLHKYDTNSFWVNRDPRFYFTVAYNGCYWPLSAQNNYRIWTYYYYVKTDRKSIEGNVGSVTGFYCRKFVNPSIQKINVDKVGTDWIEIRFAEVLLNFAECANEIGKTDTMRWALNRIRNERTDVKVGMAYIDENLNDQTIMREIIMTERQIELAFENKRYWDLRRRNMFENDLGPNIKKLNGTRRTSWIIELQASVVKEQFDLERDIREFDKPAGYNKYFKPGYEENLDTESPFNYPQPKYNFFGLPQTNIDKNPLLEQTLYWGGTFDPFLE